MPFPSHRALAGSLTLFLSGLLVVAVPAVALADSDQPADFAAEINRDLAHQTGVNSAVWSPDGKQIATLGWWMRRVALWNSETGAKLREFEIGKGPGQCWSIDFTRNGNFIVTTADFDAGDKAHAAVALWKEETGEFARFVSGPHPDKRRPANVAHVFAAAHGGDRLAVGELSTRSDSVSLYTGEEWASPSALPVGRDTAEALTFSPDGQRLAVGTVLSQLLLFDVTERKLIWKTLAYDNNNLGVMSVAYSPDGRFIATGSNSPMSRRILPGGHLEPDVSEHPLAIWDAATGNFVRALPGSAQKIQSLSWSGDGRFIAATQDDNMVRFWAMNAPEKAPIELRLASPVTSVAFAPNSLKFVVAANGSAFVGEIAPR